jgi:hypothetical protein
MKQCLNPTEKAIFGRRFKRLNPEGVQQHPRRILSRQKLPKDGNGKNPASGRVREYSLREF